MTPNGALGNLAGHQVVEHDDGTITVAPSILCHPHGELDENDQRVEKPGWHGFLECGVWRSC